jgi:hypothetical protein
VEFRARCAYVGSTSVRPNCGCVLTCRLHGLGGIGTRALSALIRPSPRTATSELTTFSGNRAGRVPCVVVLGVSTRRRFQPLTGTTHDWCLVGTAARPAHPSFLNSTPAQGEETIG